MPNKPVPWLKLWPELVDHEKFAQLTDSECWTWVKLLAKSGQQPTRGRFRDVTHAVVASGRPKKHVERLIAVRLLDQRADGLWMHDWEKWQRWRPEDAINTNGPPDQPPTGQPSARDEHAINNGSTRLRDKREEIRDEEFKNEIPPAPSGHPPRLHVVGESVPKPTHKPIDDEYLSELAAEFGPRLGGEVHVRLVIDHALNHRQYTKAIDKRRYLRNWLCRDVEYAQSRIAAGGGRAYRKPLTDQQLEDLPF